jgi:hypothetical protein
MAGSVHHRATMLRISLLCASVTAALALAACADKPATTETAKKSQSSQPFSINSCDDGVEACAGNAQCESCLIEGECAAGPSPVWTGTECVCTDNDPSNCVYQFCCALGFAWNPDACQCLPCGDEHGDDDDDEQ